jgi:predicted DNA-binding protein
MTDNSNIDEIIFEINPRLKQFPQLLSKAKQDIQQELLKARIDELNRYDTDEDMYKTLRTADLQNQVQAS